MQDSDIQILQIVYEDDFKIDCLADIALLEKNIFHDPWDEKILDDMLGNKFNFIFAALTNGKISGYYCMQYIAGEGELLRIAVSPEMRRKGIGEKMMLHMEKDAQNRKCEKIFLEVNENNFGAVSLYNKNGFNQISKRKDYYGKGENALIMVKDT